MICIYHHGCMDGFGAAWVVWKKFQGKEIKFVPARYGDEAINVYNEDVIIVDFSYPRDILQAMAKQANSIIVLDHHKTAQANCDGLDFAIFDMNRSGAVMAWEFFFPDKPMPIFIDYIQDRDLWRFELDYSKEINAAMYSYQMDFEVWDTQFQGPQNLYRLQDEGTAIIRDRQKTIDSLISGWAIDRLNIAGYDVPCLNCPHWLASDVLNILANSNEPFAVSYSDSTEQRTFQLRSSKDGVDVSEIAKQFGGGGHKHAAGFVIDKPKIL